MLVRELRRRKRMRLGELCLLWNVGPDRAMRLVKSMTEIDEHIKIRGKTIVWEEVPYESLLADLELDESEKGVREEGIRYARDFEA